MELETCDPSIVIEPVTSVYMHPKECAGYEAVVMAVAVGGQQLLILHSTAFLHFRMHLYMTAMSYLDIIVNDTYSIGNHGCGHRVSGGFAADVL